MATKSATNYDRLKDFMAEKKSFIVYDVEATGMYDADLDNRLTQIALAAYSYNKEQHQYELQDRIFMLARPDEAALRELEQLQKPTPKNAEKILRNKYVGSELRKADSVYMNISKPMEERIAAGKRLKYISENRDFLMKSPECDKYVEENLEKKINHLKSNVPLSAQLKLQGIKEAEWRGNKTGLTPEEMQHGIVKFLEKYDTNETVILTNGTVASNSYLDKIGLPSTYKRNRDYTVDVAQVFEKFERLQGKREIDTARSFQLDLRSFSDRYENVMGRQIKTHDAFTTALCLAQIACTSMGEQVFHNSKESIAAFAAEKVANKSNDYILAATAEGLTNGDFAISNKREEFPDWANPNYNFEKSHYIKFGKDSYRFIDVDHLFRINGDFKVTIVGDKTPIETWDELKNKITALNAEISPELLGYIEKKYNEFLQDAELKKEVSIKTVDDDLIKQAAETKTAPENSWKPSSKTEEKEQPIQKKTGDER